MQERIQAEQAEEGLRRQANKSGYKIVLSSLWCVAWSSAVVVLVIACVVCGE
jgi:Flp pilus assembly protein TadB